MNQLGFPSQITAQEVKREKTLGGAIALCARAGGLEPKQLQDALRLDKAQWSRWESGGEGILWPKMRAVMDECGNDAPLLWMNMDRGYDLSSIRRVETELERKLREAEETIKQMQHDHEVELNVVRRLRVVGA